jgi:hypothetical protein
MSKTAKEAVSEFLLAFQRNRDTIEQGYSGLGDHSWGGGFCDPSEETNRQDDRRRNAMGLRERRRSNQR